MASLKSCGSQGAELAPDPCFLTLHPPFPQRCRDLRISFISGSLELVPSSESTTDRQ